LMEAHSTLLLERFSADLWIDCLAVQVGFH